MLSAGEGVESDGVIVGVELSVGLAEEVAVDFGVGVGVGVAAGLGADPGRKRLANAAVFKLIVTFAT